MKISIVSGSYNAKHALPLMYEQFLKQEEDIHEWIICDDGSLDGTFELLKEYTKHPKISAYWQSNSGIRLSASLNNGLRRATGDVIFILMGDTYLRPDTMRKIHTHYIKGTAGSGLRRNVLDGKFHSWDWRYNEDLFDKTVKLPDQKNGFSFLTGNVMLIDSEGLKKAGYYNEDYCHGYGRDDWSVFLRLYKVGIPLYQYNTIICDHIYHGEGQPDDIRNVEIFMKEYKEITQ